MIDVIRAKIDQADDEGPLRDHLRRTLAGPEGPPDRQVLDEAVQLCRTYIVGVPDTLEQAAETAALTGGLEQIAPLLSQVGAYFVSDHDLMPDHLGVLGLLDDAFLANRTLEVLSANYHRLAGVPLVGVDLGPVNRAAAVFLGAEVAHSLAAAAEQSVSRRVHEVQLQALHQTGFAAHGGGGTFEDQAGRFMAEHGASFSGAGDIDIVHNPVW
jgi:hypothetical protein